jgi:hypothetical protein
MEAEMVATRNKHTVLGLGSRIFLMSFFALVENQDGQLKSALKIYMKGLNFNHPLEKGKPKLVFIVESANPLVKCHEIRIFEWEVPRHEDKENHST